MAVEEVFLDLEVGRQEEVVNPERLVEVLQGSGREGQWEGEELTEQELVGGEQFALEGEDVMKVVEAVAEGEPESEAGAKHPEEEAGHGGKCTWPPLEELQALTFAQAWVASDSRPFPLPSSPCPAQAPPPLTACRPCQQSGQKGMGKDAALAQKLGMHWMMALLRSRMGLVR